MIITLNASELAELNKYDQADRNNGGFQNYICQLQDRVGADGSIDITDEDIERIKRYVEEYAPGGWEDSLRTIFERSLGQI